MTEVKTEKKPSSDDLKLLNEHVKLANAGDSKSIEWLRCFLDKNPQIWAALGDLARTAERAWIELVANGDVLARESITRQLTQLKVDLIGESPSPVEKMLGDQVLATWVEVRYLETVSADSKGGSLTQAGLLLKQLESSQKRHLNAIRSLVQTRKLLPRDGSIPVLRIFNEERATG
jgi:hypothetical protein